MYVKLIIKKNKRLTDGMRTYELVVTGRDANNVRKILMYRILKNKSIKILKLMA